MTHFTDIIQLPIAKQLTMRWRTKRHLKTAAQIAAVEMNMDGDRVEYTFNDGSRLRLGPNEVKAI